jgi:undecaprenyl-diphosphatase
MSHLVAIILGFVEGATEFLPISSSGHLIIVRQILGENNLGGLAFDAILQLATSCALLVYFWKDILGLLNVAFGWLTRKNIDKKNKTLLLSIIIGTIPAVVFGLFLENYMDTLFRNIQLVALTLVLGSVLFWVAEKWSRENKILTIGKGIVIGFFQCLALVPGISRSGATISGGLLAGLTKDEAVRFSFLLSIPVLFGAGLKKLFEVRSEIFTTGYGSSLLLGSLVAFVVGLISINFLIKYLKTHSLKVFIWYRIALALIILIAFGF